MNRLRLTCSWVAFLSLTFAVQRPVPAQRPSGGPPIDRILRFLDRNRSGEIDPEEFDRMPGPYRDAMSRLGIDGSRPVGLEELERLGPQLQEALRFRREDSGRRRFGRGDRSDRRDSGDRGRSSRSTEPAPRPKVTYDLPDSHRERDKDGDGQIGLYEWDRAQLAEFFKLDRNRDGFITPVELLFPGGTSSPPATARPGTTTANSPTTATATTPTSSSSSSSSSGSSSSRSSGGSDRSAETSRYERFAQFTFRSLDRDRDGKLTEEEWERSRRTKDQFEEAKVALPLPATYEQFKPAYIKVRTADE